MECLPIGLFLLSPHSQFLTIQLVKNVIKQILSEREKEKSEERRQPIIKVFLVRKNTTCLYNFQKNVEDRIVQYSSGTICKINTQKLSKLKLIILKAGISPVLELSQNISRKFSNHKYQITTLIAKCLSIYEIQVMPIGCLIGSNQVPILVGYKISQKILKTITINLEK